VPATDSTSICSSAGTEFQIVTPASAMQASQRAGSRNASAGGTTTLPPAASSPSTSYTDRSKLSDDSASTASFRPTAKRRLISAIVLPAPR
jgi:hypothetical protein